ncbi:MAG: permease, partial [Deltaproteobacteria bacterium]|nr:permease [Deltaproteobacteria bacterium]
IAGAISVFVSQAAVLKYFGAEAKKLLSYSVASVSGTVLAVCSCTVLPLFAGIYLRGAGIGPATAFLYSGPAINVLAIVLTAKVLGWRLGLARAMGAVVFAVIAGLAMAAIYRREDRERAEGAVFLPDEGDKTRSLLQDSLYLLTMILILVFAAWAKPASPEGLWAFIYGIKWYLAVMMLIVLAVMLKAWFKKEELTNWVQATWGFALQILPLLFIGVLAAGFLLGRPGYPALIPESFIAGLVGGNTLWANFFASISGALMYFATLTEVPILQGLIGAGMGQGPALALLLAGPSLSLPAVITLTGVMGLKKTLVYATIVVILATGTGMIYGWMTG